MKYEVKETDDEIDFSQANLKTKLIWIWNILINKKVKIKRKVRIWE